MKTDTLIKGTVVTLLTSYCGDSSKGCTNKNPCKECVEMCNTFVLVDNVKAKYTGQVDLNC